MIGRRGHDRKWESDSSVFTLLPVESDYTSL